MSAAPSMPPEPWRIREARASDVGFVTDAWRESYYVGGPSVQYADRDDYRRKMTAMFSEMLRDAAVLVACDSEDEDTLIGFAAHTKGTLHYVYIKADFRKMGIARALCERVAPTSYDFRTLAGERRLRPRERRWRFLGRP